MIGIGELSRRTGVNIETIRYYERIGLVSIPPRTGSGRRAYGPSHVTQLAFVRHARELGFDIATIKSLLALQGSPESPCTEVARIAREQLAAVEKRLTSLAALQGELRRMIRKCRNHKVSDCRIIESLSSNDQAHPEIRRGT